MGPFADSGSVIIPSSYTNIFNKCLLRMDYLLSVEFTSFTASIIDNGVTLNWATATELNNSGFEIQSKKSSAFDGRSQESEWETIGFVPGFGTTTEQKLYSFSDENVSTGVYKYRLKQIDFDRSFEYSNEIEVEVDFTPEEFVLYQNYPNPFNPSTTIKYEIPLRPPLLKGESEAGRFVTLKVYDILGNEVSTLVNEEKQPGVYEVEFSVGQDSSPDIASGIYFYQLKADSFVQTKKMILLR